MSDNTKDNIVDVSDAARSVPTMLLLLTLSILLMLGIIQTSLTLLSLTRKIRLLAVFTFPFSDFRLYHTPSALRARPPDSGGGQSGWAHET